MQHTHLDVLHDHYKDSFSQIRNRERQRDRLFLVVIAILGFTVLQLRYTALSGVVSEISVGSAKIDLTKLPGPVILSTTWTFLLALMLRYCQVAVHIEKQYDYLHSLENHIALAFDNDHLYRREGRAYFAKKTAYFRNWTWFFYTFIFPAIVLAAVGLSVCSEIMSKHIPTYHKWYDILLAVAVIISLVCYKIGLCLER